jgi:hypothetical protein
VTERHASPHFDTHSLAGVYTHGRSELPHELRSPPRFLERHGTRVIRGIPFDLGGPGSPDVLLLDGEAVIPLGGTRASYLLIMHVARDVSSTTDPGFAEGQVMGLELGGEVAEYVIEYDDGSRHATPILRRFGIQQTTYQFGTAPFACVPADDDEVISPFEDLRDTGRLAELDRNWATSYWREPRVFSAFVEAKNSAAGQLWLYALPNPRPDDPVRALRLLAQEEVAVYAVSSTRLAEHPFRWGTRRKVRAPIPAAAAVNALGEVDGIGIDLGVVISARRAIDYDLTQWRPDVEVVPAAASSSEMLVEFTSHPRARLHLGDSIVPVDELGSIGVPSATIPVNLVFVDSETRRPVAVRLHLHGTAGEYLPPRGHHRIFSRSVLDGSPEFARGPVEYAYIGGECVVDLPIGTVYLEALRGFECVPVRTTIEVSADTTELRFDVQRVLPWRHRGWVSADTHVHALSPQTALLEGTAEDVNVVNLLAAQWGEVYTNVGDFDGKTTFGAEEFGGTGEFLVRLGSENRSQSMGHISLLGYSGELIQPLSRGGTEEAAFGDAFDVAMAEWAQRCIEQNGLVVLPHGPLPQAERAADVVLGLVHAIELTQQFPAPTAPGGFSSYAIADWYRYLNLGYHIPAVAGTDKMGKAGLLGSTRTYAYLGDREFTYEEWKDTVKRGDTFVTMGPLISFSVDGRRPGQRLDLPAGGGELDVEWTVDSVVAPVDRIEIVAGGVIVEEVSVRGLSGRGTARLRVEESTWIALRVRGGTHPDGVLAHSSAVMIGVAGSELLAPADGMAVLDQIQGTLAYVDTIATPGDARRMRAIRSLLESSYAKLHARMHAAGVYHHHSLHDVHEPHEH